MRPPTPPVQTMEELGPRRGALRRTPAATGPASQPSRSRRGPPRPTTAASRLRRAHLPSNPAPVPAATGLPPLSKPLPLRLPRSAQLSPVPPPPGRTPLLAAASACSRRKRGGGAAERDTPFALPAPSPPGPRRPQRARRSAAPP